MKQQRNSKRHRCNLMNKYLVAAITIAGIFFLTHNVAAHNQVQKSIIIKGGVENVQNGRVQIRLQNKTITGAIKNGTFRLGPFIIPDKEKKTLTGKARFYFESSTKWIEYKKNNGFTVMQEKHPITLKKIADNTYQADPLFITMPENKSNDYSQYKNSEESVYISRPPSYLKQAANNIQNVIRYSTTAAINTMNNAFTSLLRVRPPKQQSGSDRQEQ